MLKELIVIDELKDGLKRRLIAAPLYKNKGSFFVDLILAVSVDRGVHFKMTNLKKIEKGGGIFFELDATFKKGVVLIVRLLSWPSKYLAVLEITDDGVVFSDPCDILCDAYKLTKAKKFF